MKGQYCHCSKCTHLYLLNIDNAYSYLDNRSTKSITSRYNNITYLNIKAHITPEYRSKADKYLLSLETSLRSLVLLIMLVTRSVSGLLRYCTVYCILYCTVLCRAPAVLVPEHLGGVVRLQHPAHSGARGGRARRR